MGVMLPYTPLHYLILRSQKIGVRSQESEANGSTVRLSVSAELTPKPHAEVSPKSERSTQRSRRSLTDNSQQPNALVMTSGNMSEEPIAIGNEEALDRLSGIADYFLIHNRDIYLRSDDSIVKIIKKSPALRTMRLPPAPTSSAVQEDMFRSLFF